MQFEDEKSPVFRLQKLIEEGKTNIPISGLKGSSLSYLLSLLKKEIERSFLIVTARAEEAKEFLEEIGFFWGKKGVLFFPPWEVSPFENLSFPRDITIQRLEVLLKLYQNSHSLVVIAPIKALMSRVIPQEVLRDYTWCLRVGEEVPREEFERKLVEGGYSRVPLVEEKGDFGVRGAVLDIFPPLYSYPLRVEFFSDEIVSLREFDPISQRSLQKVDKVTIPPSREIILSEERKAKALARVGQMAQELGLSLDEEFLDNSSPLEAFLPYFYETLDTIFDYLPKDTLVFFTDPEELEGERDGLFQQQMKEIHSRSMKQRKILPSLKDLYLSSEELSFNGFQIVLNEELEFYGLNSRKISFYTEENKEIQRMLSESKAHEGLLHPLVRRIREWQEERNYLFLICYTPGQAERLKKLLEGYELEVNLNEGFFLGKEREGINIQVGRLRNGFRFPLHRLIILTEEEIFGQKIAHRPSRMGPFISDFGELRVGDFVVHRDFGTGIYRGLKKLEVEGDYNDYLSIEYLGGDKLYLPVYRTNLIQRYKELEGSSPKPDKLGGTSWKRKKERVRRFIQKMAKELLDLYATRQVLKGFPFSKPDHYYREFEASFEYEETPDQEACIEEVMRDMESERPMERLVCGDVGYGKTEVALRASFKAVMDGKQVAILVPTTVLAFQHYQTFSHRLRSYPISVEMFSRLRSKSQQKEIAKGLGEGKIDIIIGTHRLLQGDVTLKDLGLLVIDEEHRFGVSHKERIKKLKRTVDALTLTATPIPRTLYMSLSGIRNLSLITTPPQDRLAIRTHIAKFDGAIIKEAILEEMRRGGQVFFVHNWVKTIETMAIYLKRLVPEAKLAIAHGKLPSAELERTMLGFLKKEIDLLLTTTIIESGLDFPSANTIIINRADKLGLAQLYQLRGRVGRSSEQAYCYFLIPGRRLLSREARSRLKAISELTELGSGFRLANYDLEIRGAGNLLGPQQSGHVAAVGFDMYMNLLEKVISELKGEKIVPEIEPEIKIKVPAYIPDDYIPDTNQRLMVYRRLALTTSEEETSRLVEEICDRYGKPPSLVENLIEVVKVKNLLRRFFITSLDFNGREIVLQFHPEGKDFLKGLLRNNGRFKVSSEGLKLRITFRETNWRKVMGEVRKLLSL